MTHPHVLHATAALWSLSRSWPALHHARTRGTLDAADGLRGSVYGTRHATGGTPGGADLALIGAELERDRWARLAERTADQVIQACWLVRSAAPATERGGGPLRYVQRGLQVVAPATARDIGAYLGDADHAIRAALGVGDGRGHLPGVPCPGCDVRMLQTVETATRDAWIVLCGANCRCAGKQCPCSSTGTPHAGLPHAWTWAQLAARAEPAA